MLPFCLNGQISVKPGNVQPFGPDQIIESTFLGNGVDILSDNYFGVDKAVGIFENGLSTVGLERGIVISTGPVDLVPRNSTEDSDEDTSLAAVTDEDLEALAGVSLRDVAKYEIKFIPTSDTLRFRYVFASEEYPDQQCRNTNDAFGFFIKGPNPNGPDYDFQNIALIPDPDNPGEFLDIPVTINTVNNGIDPTGGTNCDPPQGSLDYSQYYNDTQENQGPIFNGHLDIFTAEAIVVPCEVYTIKIAIGDGRDNQFDSAVFLEEKSFSTGSLKINIDNPGVDGGISEGCQAGKINIALDNPVNEDYPINFRIINDPSLPQQAIEGIDFLSLNTDLVIPQGSSSVDLALEATIDSQKEDTEFIYIEIDLDVCNKDTLIVPVFDNSLDFITLPDTIETCFNQLGEVSVEIGNEVNITELTQFSSIDNIEIPNEITQVESVIEVTDIPQAILQSRMIAEVCIDSLVHPQLNDLDIFLQAPSGQLLELSTDNGQRANNPQQLDAFVQTCFTLNASENINRGNPEEGQLDINNPGYTGQYLPEGDWNDWLNPIQSPSNGIYKLLIINDEGIFPGELFGWSISFNATYEISYEWFPQNGIMGCNNCPDLNFRLPNSQYYYLRLTDSYGCSNLDSIWIDVAPLPEVFNTSCESSSPSSINFTWDSDPNNLDYDIRVNEQFPWFNVRLPSSRLLNGYRVISTGNNEVSVNGLLPEEEMSIIIRATNDRGCFSHFDTLFCQSMPCTGTLPTIDTIMIDQPACDNAGDVDVFVFANDIHQPLTYRLDITGLETRENNDGRFLQVPQGNWELRIIDSEGCAILDTIRINDPLPINIEATVNNISCNNANDGSISVIVNSTDPPYSYEWNLVNDQDSLIENLSAGIYEVTVTDNIGCTQTDRYEIINPAPIIYTYEQIDTIDCLGLDPGIATINISGGLAPYNIDWMNGIQTDTIFNQEIGIQIFSITDQYGCEILDSAMVIQNLTFDVETSNGELSCFTDTLGTATVIASNGIEPYSYEWDNGETNADATMLHAGNNFITVTDAEGCRVVSFVNIPSPPAIQMDVNMNPTSCTGASDGSLQVLINGGIGAPYDINWFDNSNEPIIEDLSAGEYCVTVTDGNDCSAVSCFNVEDALPIEANGSIVDVRCMGECNGAINLNPVGGTGVFFYSWSGPDNFSANTMNIDNLCEGQYQVTITEQNNPNCNFIFEWDVSISSQLEATIDVNRFVSCFGASDAVLVAIPQNGIAPYNYEWSNNVISTNDNAALNLAQGTYSLTITDSNGCTNTALQELSQPDSLKLDFSVVDVECFGEQTGSVEVFIEGGTAPYLINWETGSMDSMLFDLSAGNYSVSITDRLGCTTIDKAFIDEPKNPIELSFDVKEVTCAGGQDGQVRINTQNATEPVSYSLDGSAFKFDPNFVALTAGTYIVDVVDADGCTQRDSVEIPENIAVEVDLGEDILVNLGGDATLNTTVANNSGTLLYEWDSPLLQLFSCTDCPNPKIENISRSFIAFVVVTDENGCTGRDFVNIFVDIEDVIFVPTMFTPNNDNVNDRMNIFGSEDLQVTNFKVYNRNGSVIYESTNEIPNDPFNGWNGFTNGQLAPQGSYTWTAEFMLKNGEIAFSSGQSILKI